MRHLILAILIASFLIVGCGDGDDDDDDDTKEAEFICEQLCARIIYQCVLGGSDYGDYEKCESRCKSGLEKAPENYSYNSCKWECTVGDCLYLECYDIFECFQGCKDYCN